MPFNLDKQIGPFPLKIWLIISAGGIGIGYLVTRSNDGSSAKAPSTSNADVSAINTLSSRIQKLSMENESVATSNTGTQSMLQRLQSELAALKGVGSQNDALQRQVKTQGDTLNVLSHNYDSLLARLGSLGTNTPLQYSTVTSRI